MRFFISIILIALGFVGLSSFGPKDGKKRAPKLKTLFACKQGGKLSMSAEQFLNSMSEPLCAKDSLDNSYRILSFELLYAETGLYQDSAGLPIIHTDYSFATFEGNTIDSNWISLFKEHAYKGDTIRFNKIRVKGFDSLNYLSSNIELILR